MIRKAGGRLVQQRNPSSRPSRAAVVLVALWLALMVASVGVALLTDELGAGLAAGGLLTAVVLYLGIDVDPPAAA